MVFGIRPENIQEMDNKTATTTDQAITGIIDVSELIGAETYLYISLDEQPMIVRVDSHTKATIGQPHQFILDSAKIHFFDKTTEKTIE